MKLQRCQAQEDVKIGCVSQPHDVGDEQHRQAAGTGVRLFLQLVRHINEVVLAGLQREAT